MGQQSLEKWNSEKAIFRTLTQQLNRKLNQQILCKQQGIFASGKSCCWLAEGEMTSGPRVKWDGGEGVRWRWSGHAGGPRGFGQRWECTRKPPNQRTLDCRRLSTGLGRGLNAAQSPPGQGGWKSGESGSLKAEVGTPSLGVRTKVRWRGSVKGTRAGVGPPRKVSGAAPFLKLKSS